jgi:hypothetical protein
MGTYKTKPEEVEAIQYTGDPKGPFSGQVPAWVWTGMQDGTLMFNTLGVEIRYNGLSEQVIPGDWLVRDPDGVVRACDDKTFTQYYVPYKMRRTKAEVEAERAAKAAFAAAPAATPVEAPVEAAPETIAPGGYQVTFGGSTFAA